MNHYTVKIEFEEGPILSTMYTHEGDPTTDHMLRHLADAGLTHKTVRRITMVHNETLPALGPIGTNQGRKIFA